MKLKTSITFFIFLLLSGNLLAQSTGLSGFDLHLFRPPVDGTGLLNLHRSETLDQWQFHTGLFLETGHGLLAAANPVTGANIRIVNDLMTANLQAAVGLTSFLDAGINLPVVVWERGTNFNTGVGFTTASLGDIELDLKLRLIRDSGIKPSVAFLSRVTFPSGSTSKFTGDPTVGYEGRLIVDKKIGPVGLVSNLGYRTVGRTQVVNLDIDDSLTYGGGASVTLPFQERSIDLMAEVDGSTVLRNPRKITSPLEWLVGVRKKTKTGLTFQVAGGRGITGGVGGGEWRVIGGMQFTSQKASTRETEAKEPVLLETIYFRFNRDKFLPKYERKLDTVAERIKPRPKKKIKIRGHADSEGTENYNLNLSQRRAENVRKSLEKRGVPSREMTVEALGSREPVSDNRTFQGKAKNRRVEILEIP